MIENMINEKNIAKEFLRLKLIDLVGNNKIYNLSEEEEGTELETDFKDFLEISIVKKELKINTTSLIEIFLELYSDTLDLINSQI